MALTPPPPPGTGHLRRNRWLIAILFLFASIHCARSIFTVNVSLLDLPGYEHGTEAMPFQGRVGMIPLLRWAHRSEPLAKAAAFFDHSLRRTPHMQNPPEAYTPEKLFCMLAGILSITAMTFASLWYGRRHFEAGSDFWWLPGVLTLGMLYVTYGARYEMPFWYPYDLPHFAIFGIACLLLLEDMQLPMFLLFLVDVPLRETSIYLIPLVIAVGYSRGKLKQALPVAMAMVCVWLPIQILIAHHFWHNASVKRIPLPSMIRAIANPLHWPQVMSAFGFLAIPLFLGRRYLSREQFFFLLGAVPCLAVTLLFGIWYETRIWDEWIVPAAALLATEIFAKGFAKKALHAETEQFHLEYESA